MPLAATLEIKSDPLTLFENSNLFATEQPVDVGQVSVRAGTEG